MEEKRFTTQFTQPEENEFRYARSLQVPSDISS
jgi:hypothetical protein